MAAPEEGKQLSEALATVRTQLGMMKRSLVSPHPDPDSSDHINCFTATPAAPSS